MHFFCHRDVVGTRIGDLRKHVYTFLKGIKISNFFVGTLEDGKITYLIMKLMLDHEVYQWLCKPLAFMMPSY